MEIFFTASYEGKKEYQENYTKIIDAIRRSGGKPISLEVQSYEDLLGKSAFKKAKKEEIHYLFIKKGIDKAQAVIIEASTDDFQIGHEASLALIFNKPVLCLSTKRDYSTTIIHPKFYSQKYSSLDELDKYVKDFLDLVRHKYLSVRFNGYLSPEQKNFLDWYADRHNSNASSVIRDLIDKRMSESEDYQDDRERLFLDSSSTHFK